MLQGKAITFRCAHGYNALYRLAKVNLAVADPGGGGYTPRQECCTKSGGVTGRCEDSFQKLKNLLCVEAVLQNPDFTKEFLLQTDSASDVGVGAVLSQLDEEGADHPVPSRAGNYSPESRNTLP